MIYIGVDPGKRGGFAYIDDNGQYVTYPWDDHIFIDTMFSLSINQGIIACVEKVSSMPNQGVASMFSFGKSAGYIEGVLSALSIPYQLVVPRKWKHEFSLGNSKDDSITICQRLFPEANLYRTPKCYTPSDGMAEALLIAEYGRRLYKRGGKT